LVFQDQGSAGVVKRAWCKRLVAKTPLGDMVREHVVNVDNGASLSEAETLAIKEVSDFYWFWRKPAVESREGVKWEATRPDRPEAREDVLYFLNYFTHSTRCEVYETLCESILRNKKFMARLSSILQEDGTGLKISRVTELAVDDVISTHQFTTVYGSVLNVRTLADTRAHILNQLLLYALMARSARPLNGAQAGVGEGRKGKVQVLFRKGGPLDRRSPPAPPSKLLW